MKTVIKYALRNPESGLFMQYSSSQVKGMPDVKDATLFATQGHAFDQVVANNKANQPWTYGTYSLEIVKVTIVNEPTYTVEAL